MTQTLLFSSILLLAQADTDPAERLVRAEVLEVAKGDLEKAMAEYRAIEGDEKAPASVRARALLALGRCQRKRGELEAARRTFADLLARHPEEKETTRRAKGFLAEIEKGRPENPDFDWLGDLEKSPEIQARVFELAMQAAGSDSSEPVTLAVRQLLALGRAALPVLDKVIEVSGDRLHRRRLVAVELHAGRWDRLPLALEDGFPIPWVLGRFLESLPGLTEERRRALLAELDKMPAEASTDLGHLVRLWAGDVSRVKEAVPTLQNYPLSKELALRIADAGPAGGEALAAIVLDPQSDRDRALACFHAIREKRPEALSDDIWVARVERGSSQQQEETELLREMERQGKFAALETLARGPRASNVANYFVGTYNPQGPQGNVPTDGEDLQTVDLRWARILRVAKAAYALSFLAAMRDDALSEYVGFLQNAEYAEGDPNVPPRPPRPGRVTRVALARPPSSFQVFGPDTQGSENPWVPSDAYARAMVPLLDHTDSAVVHIALGALSRADVKSIEDTVPRIERLARESQDPTVRYRAIAALLSLFAGDPEKAKSAAAIWIAEAERDPGVPSPNMKAHTKHVIGKVNQWVPNIAHYPFVLRAANDRGAALFHDAYVEGWQDVRPLYELLDEVTHPHLMASVFEVIQKALRRPLEDGAANKEQILPFLERLARDRRVRVQVRTQAWALAGEPFAWFDLPALLSSDDPLAVRLVTHEGLRDRVWNAIDAMAGEKRDQVFQAALSSPLEEVRKAVIRKFPLDTPRAGDVLRRGLEDQAASVREAAIEQLGRFTRADAAPAFTGLLRHEDKRVRVAVLDALTRFADPESIEPMIALLDDPDTEVRSKALEGVKQIQRVIGEKGQWKDWARRAKTGEGPTPGIPAK